MFKRSHAYNKVCMFIVLSYTKQIYKMHDMSQNAFLKYISYLGSKFFKLNYLN